MGWLAFGRIGAVTYSLAGAVMAGLSFPPANVVVFGLAVGCLVVLSKTWGAFVFSLTWLALRGQQPWRLMRFLEDARRRGVLRQAGGVYQFRHARLQDHLIKPGKAYRVRKERALSTVSTDATAVNR